MKVRLQSEEMMSVWSNRTVLKTNQRFCFFFLAFFRDLFDAEYFYIVVIPLVLQTTTETLLFVDFGVRLRQKMTMVKESTFCFSAVTPDYRAETP